MARSPATTAAHTPLAAARRAAALVNVLGEAEPDAARVTDVLRAFGESVPRDPTAGELARLRQAADLLRAVFQAPSTAAAADALNRLLAAHTGPVRLSTHAGHTSWHPHVDHADDAPWHEWFLASSCLALTVLLWEHQRAPGGVCASAACADVFVTVGGGPDRRYCCTRCATRERVAAHRTTSGPGRD